MGYELSLLMGATGLVLAVALVQVVVLVRLARTATDITRMHDRLTRMVAALDLLTDTAETGFRQFADHLEQRAPSAQAAAAPAKRPEGAARRTAPAPVQAAAAPAAAPVRASRKPAKSAAAPVAATPRPAPVADAPMPAQAAQAPTLLVATRKAARRATARHAAATMAAFREVN